MGLNAFCSSAAFIFPALGAFSTVSVTNRGSSCAFFHTEGIDTLPVHAHLEKAAIIASETFNTVTIVIRIGPAGTTTVIKG